MSIDSINIYQDKVIRSEKVLSDDSKIETDVTTNLITSANATPSKAQDSINIRTTISNSSNNELTVNNNATTMNYSDAKKAVSSVVSYLQNNGSELLRTLNAPVSKVALDLVYEMSE